MIIKKKNTRTAIYPGTFDPMTLGHLDILKRAAGMFDKVIISVAAGSSKKTLFTIDERIGMIRKIISNIKNVSVKSFDGLLVDYAKNSNAGIIIRGIRSVSDFDFEFQMALTNKKLSPAIETVFLFPSEIYSYISSTLVREIALNGSDVSEFVPPIAAKEIKKKFS